MVLKEIKKSWILSSGLIGCENQCLGVIERLGIETEIKKIKPKDIYKKIIDLNYK